MQTTTALDFPRPVIITDHYSPYRVMYRAQGQMWQLYPQSCETQEDARLLTMRVRSEHPGVNIDTLVLVVVDEWTTLTKEEAR